MHKSIIKRSNFSLAFIAVTFNCKTHETQGSNEPGLHFELKFLLED